MRYELEPLVIGDMELPVPIIQGGMGVKVSTAPLAAAVAECGGGGTIASVALGFGAAQPDENFVASSRRGLIDQLRQARSLTDKPIGVNILTALSNYEDLVDVCVEEKADFIVSGAGLPLKLPQYAEGSNAKLIPIVSSARAAELIIRTWSKRYGRCPDAIVVEGPMAGGHLGFDPSQLSAFGDRDHILETIVSEVVAVAGDHRGPNGRPIPVIAAGGVYDGSDMARMMRLGASGVQMATRFVATHECTVPDSFKQLYVDATPDDLAIIPSPVGMPGRVILTDFTRAILAGQREKFQCRYRCLKGCNPATAPFCIAKALRNAIEDDPSNAVVFAGSNVAKIDRIMSVAELMDEVASEAAALLAVSR